MTENIPVPESKRFIGDRNSRVVHDITKKLCQVGQDIAVDFESLDQAHAAQYTNCRKCLCDLFISPIGYMATGQSQRTVVVQKKRPPRPKQDD